jgi:glycosyltransferase involved in cell wall biosynthesis
VSVLSLVIPVYRNEGSLPDLLAAVAGLDRASNGAFEVVFVIDGSPDRCYQILRDVLPSQPFHSRLLLLSRNFGSFAAIRAGLEAAQGERFAVMAADLQEPPELVLEMDTVLRDDQADVVVAVRESRQDRAFRNQLLRLEERHSSLIAQIFWLGFRRRNVSYARQQRRHGTSAWTLRKKLNYLSDSVFAFTDLPIRLLIRTGGTVALLAAAFGVAVAASRILGWIDVPGYAATVIAIVFFGALNLFGLGIVGSYAWRTYENTKARPLSVVLRSHEHSPNSIEAHGATTAKSAID